MSRIWEIVYIRAIADLKAEASRAYIGILWWVAEPLLYMMVFYLMFGLGLRFGGDNYVAFLLCGLVPYKWFSSSVSTGANTIVSNRALINLVYVPKYALVFSTMLANLFKFFVVLALLFALLLFLGSEPNRNWIYLPVIVVVQLILTTGVAGIAALIVPIVPDFKLIVDNGLLLAFFTSGIFYDVAEKTPHLLQYISLNPLYGLIEAYRAVLLRNETPDFGGLGYTFWLGVVLLVVAIFWLHKLDRRISRMSH